MKKYFTVLIVFVSNSLSAQYTLTSADVDMEGTTIIKYKNSVETDIIIPETIDGIIVEKIGEAAFYSREHVEVKLKSVILPSSLRLVGKHAFKGNAITHLTVSPSTFINWAAFNNNLISHINGLPSKGIVYRQSDDKIDSTTIVSYGGASRIIDFIPRNVKSIEPFAFEDNKLIEVKIPDNVEKIGHRSFQVNDIINLLLPNSPFEIGTYAFLGNPLTEVTIPESMTEIPQGLFLWCNISKINFHDGVKSILRDSFYGNKLTGINLPASLEYIESSAFGFNEEYTDGPRLENLNLPNTQKEGYKFQHWINNDGNRVAVDGLVDNFEEIYRATLDVLDYYQVKFIDFDSTFLHKVNLPIGSIAEFPQDEKGHLLTQREGMVFKGWDQDLTVTEDLVLTAVYEEDDMYTATFLDGEGRIAKRQTLSRNHPSYPPVLLRSGFFFVAWLGYSPLRRSDFTARPRYFSNTRLEGVVTVNFIDSDGHTILKSQPVGIGLNATPPSDPILDGHVFKEWDGRYTNVTEDVIVTAQYEPAKSQYEVVFKGFNADEVLKTESVPYGGSATAPEVSNTASYTFTRWNNEFIDITNDLVVTALYSVTNDYHMVTFIDFDGRILRETQLIESRITVSPPADPIRSGFTFIEWSRSFNHVTSDLLLTAQYVLEGLETLYNVSFIDHDGTVLRTSKVVKGRSATPPTDPIREGHIFTGWDQDFSVINATTTITAQYTAESIFRVTFVDFDGSVLKTQDVEKGRSAIPPSDPIRKGYIFVGWDNLFSNVQNNLVITASYNLILSIEDMRLDEQAAIYPNPVTKTLYLKNSEGSVLSIVLSKINGEVILKKDINRNDSIDFSRLSAGPYILTLIKKGGEKVQHRLVKK